MNSRAIVSDFLAIPTTALPSAVWASAAYAEDLGDPWGHVRDVAGGDDTSTVSGARIILRADRDGWRNGVTVTID